jgi:hypothetical protein
VSFKLAVCFLQAMGPLGGIGPGNLSVVRPGPHSVGSPRLNRLAIQDFGHKLVDMPRDAIGAQRIADTPAGAREMLSFLDLDHRRKQIAASENLKS